MNVDIACICPGTPHRGDTVTLMDPLPFGKAEVIRKSIRWMKDQDPTASVPEILAMLTEAYLLHCIGSWTVVDAKGKPVPVSKAAVTDLLLPNTEAAMAVADAADSLYSVTVVLPLVARASTSSPSSPTDGSTSVTNGTGKRHPRRSRPSLISTSGTAGTAGCGLGSKTTAPQSST